MGRSPYVWVRDANGVWQGTPKPPSVPHWSAQNSEAQVAAMQVEARKVALTGGFAAYAEYLRIINPETPRRD